MNTSAEGFELVVSFTKFQPEDEDCITFLVLTVIEIFLPVADSFDLDGNLVGWDAYLTKVTINANRKMLSNGHNLLMMLSIYYSVYYWELFVIVVIISPVSMDDCPQILLWQNPY